MPYQKRPKSKVLWQWALANELGHLAKIVQDLMGMDTIKHILKHQIPPRCTPTYGCIVVDYQQQKPKPHQAQVTVDSDCIDYPWDVSTPIADPTTAKLLFNSTIFTQVAHFLTLDIKFFYLNKPLEWSEYMRMYLDIMPEEFVDKYHLHQLTDSDGWVYIEIMKGMYGLPQAGSLANKLLTCACCG